MTREEAMEIYDELERLNGCDLWAAVLGTHHPLYVDAETIVGAANDAVCLGRVTLGGYSQGDLADALVAASAA